MDSPASALSVSSASASSTSGDPNCCIGTPADIIVGCLNRYGYCATSASTWYTPSDSDRPKHAPKLELYVNGHHEECKHTMYVIECTLLIRGYPSLEWHANRRLCDIRERLHSPLKRLICDYKGIFDRAPFAQSGAPSGTTARLNKWFQAFAKFANSGDCPPRVVHVLLQFLQVPEPPEIGTLNQKPSLSAPVPSEALTLSESSIGSPTMRSPTKRSAHQLSLEALSSNQWELHGLSEFHVLNIGLMHLDNVWSSEGLLDMPKSEDGKDILTRSNVISGLLTGKFPMFKTLPADYVSSAQGDLAHLSLRQLLKLRVLLSDFDKRCPGIHAKFVYSLDAWLFERLGRRAISSWSFCPLTPDTDTLERLGLKLTCIIAAAESLQSGGLLSAPWWVWHIGETRFFFHAGRFECTDSFPTMWGALTVQDKGTSEYQDDGHSVFYWRIAYVATEGELDVGCSKDIETCEADL